ncbi:HIT family protein [Apilactobacillus kunkeei]|mgnify:CR=1 FL=1|uniref:Histidine triad (HIT) protein n=1 Tax=Apilactobacillus kunkeei DSM 12361 = ATCC 700308 TaxID=1423768 RepID=A0A0R1FSE8_9LACO|nr:HIT family protein [Apilactobacillus kunkeei]KOY70030.1 Histidine triad protein [Apilactobacillus kunkeei]KOY72901.1 Histidine triad protein [Apilactobacillus kunkeei DSM 12361 = ATCC 700308]KPN82684.1 Histidine triad protein [Apilactobacillus kunkeei]KRK24845.1 histidine triad (HIT) protein [Apilactobacillus kunkeei DSM 12361 = ATCC 700308]MCK8619388.1 HIT family protein [Apilactobacillus kunkeei]
MSDCVFCKIIDGEIPSYTIYEDEYVKAFLDISQATPGHTLVVPKKHVANIYEYDEKLAEQVFSRIPKIARAIQKSAPDILGMNIVNNNGELAYQSVFHSHFHLIPRYSENDGFSMSFQDNSDKYNEEAFEQIKANIINSLEE